MTNSKDLHMEFHIQGKMSINDNVQYLNCWEYLSGLNHRNGRRSFEYIQETSICKQNNFMPTISFISILEMQKTRVTQKTKNWANATSICNAALKTAMFWKKKNIYKTQMTINTSTIKMLKNWSNINNNLSCKKHTTHISDLSFRRNNLKIGLSALSKKPPWLFQVLPDFSKY